MAVEEEFTEYHKDSFSFGKPEKEDKKKPASAAPAASPDPKSKEGNLDDYVPEKVGEVVDNVFGKLDNLVNDAADYLFGGKKKSNLLDKTPQGGTATQIPPLSPQAQPPLTPQSPPKAPQKATSSAPPKTAPQVPTPQKAPAQRTAAISELEELPLELLSDPDLSRYFDQMKLYEGQVVKGGLCNLPQYEAIAYLKKGYWGGDFNIRFEDLKRINPGIYPMEMARSRFGGMRPVYKAQGFQFGSKEKLIRAIETDINLYLLGKDSKKEASPFHPYIYQVVSTVIK